MRPLLFALCAAALLLTASAPRGCETGPPALDPVATPGPAPRLPALRAEPDPSRGGRVVDAFGREVLLRGVNVNAFVEYWAYDPDLPTVHPFTHEDADRIAAMGWNVVRLLMSWSRVEPSPGQYDEAYLDRVEWAVRVLARRGIYTILDLHQDAWSATLAAREDEDCTGRGEPAFGWDGAPAWATLDEGLPRCFMGGLRETSPAVRRAFDHFWADTPGPGGVGIRTRYVEMLAHVAARFAPRDAVAGYDLMNEPNAISTSGLDGMDALYAEALPAIRAAEASVGAPPRLVFLEPSILWAALGAGAPAPISGDDQIVYAPHLYQGSLSPQPLSEAAFQQARREAAERLGGAPVLSGEWGAGPGRAADPEDDYFARHQALQDRYRFGATLWTWREACGDPHKASEVRAGRTPHVWGLFDVDCRTHSVRGMREPLVRALRRPLLRAAPGRIAEVRWDEERGHFEARGEAAAPGTPLLLFWPSDGAPPPRGDASGLVGLHPQPGPGGQHFLVARARGGDWTLVVEPR